MPLKFRRLKHLRKCNPLPELPILRSPPSVKSILFIALRFLLVIVVAMQRKGTLATKMGESLEQKKSKISETQVLCPLSTFYCHNINFLLSMGRKSLLHLVFHQPSPVVTLGIELSSRTS